jgi:effector-binding domain-containing protein
MRKAFVLLTLFVLAITWQCSPEGEKIDTTAMVADSNAVPAPDSAYTYQLDYGKNPGLVGIYKVPSMLLLSVLDSARLSALPEKVATNYRLLQNDIAKIGAEQANIAGQIVYAGDSSNFKFECFSLLNRMPNKQPLYSKVVVLEAEQMLVFNHFGNYGQLTATYASMLAYIKSHHLTQMGPFREYYLTDPTVEKDVKKWLTVVMLPVRK